LIAVKAKIFKGNQDDFLAYDKGSYMEAATKVLLRACS
jgi:hypothetical protein